MDTHTHVDDHVLHAPQTYGHAEPNYMLIFWWLLGLTIAEVGVTYLPLNKVVMVTLLVSMAFGKAALVALFFMHLKFEPTTLGMIALTPMVICVFLLLMLLPDSDPDDRIGGTTPAADVGEPASE